MKPRNISAGFLFKAVWNYVHFLADLRANGLRNVSGGTSSTAANFPIISSPT